MCLKQVVWKEKKENMEIIENYIKLVSSRNSNYKEVEIFFFFIIKIKVVVNSYLFK